MDRHDRKADRRTQKKTAINDYSTMYMLKCTLIRRSDFKLFFVKVKKQADGDATFLPADYASVCCISLVSLTKYPEPVHTIAGGNPLMY